MGYISEIIFFNININEKAKNQFINKYIKLLNNHKKGGKRRKSKKRKSKRRKSKRRKSKKRGGTKNKSIKPLLEPIQEPTEDEEPAEDEEPIHEEPTETPPPIDESSCITDIVLNKSNIRILINIIKDFLRAFRLREEETTLRESNIFSQTYRIIYRDNEPISTINHFTSKTAVPQIKDLIDKTEGSSKYKLQTFLKVVKNLGLNISEIPLDSIGWINSCRETRHLGKIQILLFLLEKLEQRDNTFFIIKLDNASGNPNTYKLFGFVPVVGVDGADEEEFAIGSDIPKAIINTLQIICREYPEICKSFCEQVEQTRR